MMETKGGFYISQLKQVQDRIFQKLLREKGIDLNGAQGRILFVLWKEDHLNMTEIGKRTSLANTSLTGMIDRMVEKGIVTRTNDPKNRRQIIISLTDEARLLQERYQSVSDQMVDIFYSGFEEQEILAFEETLARILNNMKEYEGR